LPLALRILGLALALWVPGLAQGGQIRISYALEIDRIDLTGILGRITPATVREASAQAELDEAGGVIQEGAARVLGFVLDFDFVGIVGSEPFPGGELAGTARAMLVEPVTGTLSGGMLALPLEDFRAAFRGSTQATCTGICPFGPSLDLEILPEGIQITGEGGHPQVVGAPGAPPEIRIQFQARLGTGVLGIAAALHGNETSRAAATEPGALALLAAAALARSALLARRFG
jgi:hypothetical protein